MRYAALILSLLLTLAPGAASAQSMNVPLILQRVLTQICGPLMQTDDMAAALRTAMEQGYRPVDWSKTDDFDPADPPRRVVLSGDASHIGTLTLARERRGQCAIDMAEAGVNQIVERSEEHLSALGLTLVYQGGEGRNVAAVWTGEGRVAVAQPGLTSPGHMLAISWDRPLNP